MRILAFHAGPHDSTAAAFDDYELVAAVAEERLTRRKNAGGMPWLAIDDVLAIAGWQRTDVDAIATTRGLLPVQYLRFSLHKEIDYAVRRWLGTEKPARELSLLCQRRRTTDSAALFRGERFLAEHGFRADTRLHFANHHEAHALAALFYTSWKDALVYTSDGVGDNVSCSVRTLKDDRLECHYGDDRWLTIQRARKASLAMAYGYATEACGFVRTRHEGKLTGLAAHGEPALAPELARHFRLDRNGLVAADFPTWGALQRMVAETCKGHDRSTIAASIQKVAEDLTVASVRHWLARSGSRRVALAGGMFANVRLNRLIAEACPVDEVFVFPAMGDDGLSVGAGTSFLLARDGLQTWLSNRRRLRSVRLGRNYDGDIDRCLAAAPGVGRHRGVAAQVAADLIVDGKVGAVYSGRMEYGPRALGARSIVASPADAAINDDLNRRLDRTDFMPFAPFVLEEDAARVFEITDVNRYAAHFMTITCAVRPEWRKRIPAVVHVDGTARPQIIGADENPLYAGILKKFRAATGLPVLINTSFNVHEEPIVNRPAECLKALLDRRVDFVVTEQAVYTLDETDVVPTISAAGDAPATADDAALVW